MDFPARLALRVKPAMRVLDVEADAVVSAFRLRVFFAAAIHRRLARTVAALLHVLFDLRTRIAWNVDCRSAFRVAINLDTLGTLGIGLLMIDQFVPIVCAARRLALLLPLARAGATFLLVT